MLAVQANSHYLLLFAYPAPPANDWNVLAKRIEGRCAGYTVTVSRVDESPELSIGWLPRHRDTTVTCPLPVVKECRAALETPGNATDKTRS